MSGKTCLITGGTSGIGRVAASELARRGANVVIVGRNPQRCDAAARAIASESGNPHVESIAADLASQTEVRRLAREFTARYPRLDVLINNAGAMFALRAETVDGIERTLAINHLAPFLLTNLLLDLIKSSVPARIINVSSDAHRDPKRFDFDDPMALTGAGGRRTYPRSEWGSLFYTLAMPWGHPGFGQYAQTKLANILFTRELARRLEGSGVTANAMHPGLVATSIADNNGIFGWFARRVLGPFAISPEKGADTIVYLSESSQVQGVSGKYFVRRKAVEPTAAASDPDTARRLWALSEQLTTH